MSTIYTYDQFLVFVDQECRRLKEEDSSIRYGQVFFNCLWEFRPTIANKIRATKMDPFHRDEVHPETHTFVENEWILMNTELWNETGFPMNGFN